MDPGTTERPAYAFSVPNSCQKYFTRKELDSVRKEFNRLFREAQRHYEANLEADFTTTDVDAARR